MSEHPSLKRSRKASENEKSLRKELFQVAETAIKKYIKTRMATTEQDLSSLNALAKLDEILREIKRKHDNIELERETLVMIKAELDR